MSIASRPIISPYPTARTGQLGLSSPTRYLQHLSSLRDTLALASTSLPPTYDKYCSLLLHHSPFSVKCYSHLLGASISFPLWSLELVDIINHHPSYPNCCHKNHPSIHFLTKNDEHKIVVRLRFDYRTIIQACLARRHHLWYRLLPLLCL